MKNTNLLRKLFDSNNEVNFDLGYDYSDEIEKTNGHIIVSWSDETQEKYKDLVMRALELDMQNLQRIHENFYKNHVDELLPLMTKNTYYVFPDASLTASKEYFKKYISFFEEAKDNFSDTFVFSHLDAFKENVLKDPKLLLGLSSACQEEMICEIYKIISRDPETLEYIKEDVLYHHCKLACQALIKDADCFYILPANYATRFENILKCLNKDVLESVIIDGNEDQDTNEKCFYQVKDKDLLNELLKITPYAILLASTKIILKMNKVKIESYFANSDIKKLFIERKPLISKIKKIQL